MKPRILFTLAVMLVMALPAGARPGAVLEDGHEVEGSFISLPASLAGQLSFGCPACAQQRFSLSRDVQFFIGEREVTLAELKLHLTAYPAKAVLIVVPRASKVVSRISAQR